MSVGSSRRKDMRELNTKEKIYDAAMKKHGIAAQSMILAEEAGELVQATSKLLRLNDMSRLGEFKEQLAEEIADVQIMIEQVSRYYGITAYMVSKQKFRKLVRLADRLEGAACCSSNG